MAAVAAEPSTSSASSGHNKESSTLLLNATAVLLRRMADAHVLSQYDCITTIEDANRARWSAAKSGYRLSMDGNA